ncbi:MAG TPA: transglutaminaseTgpA domain-containing protein, partial [Pyrinomonadaceae bacterium]|nr:transglutaminaseTgpA domain-containing protein [Pyrinomonadaceae bacterium]
MSTLAVVKGGKSFLKRQKKFTIIASDVLQDLVIQLERTFKIFAYLLAVLGLSVLWAAGGLANLSFAAALALVGGAFAFEGRFQLSERVATALIVLTIPVFYGLLRFGLVGFSTRGGGLSYLLSHLVATLLVIKLFQKKSDRDWVFIFLITFFQLLLAAGISVNATYLVLLTLYSIVFAGAMITFEIRKSARLHPAANSITPQEQPAKPSKEGRPEKASKETTARRQNVNQQFTPIPNLSRIIIVASFLGLLIIVLAIPLFFLIPRTGAATSGTEPGGVSTRTGFADTVRLGGIGRIITNDELVMRVETDTLPPENVKWLGQVLDTFNGEVWSKSTGAEREAKTRGDRDIIQVDYPAFNSRPLLQTIYLEPLDTSVLFAANRAIGLQGPFNVVFKDGLGNISFARSGDRMIYRVLSDVYQPPVEVLRADNSRYPRDFDNYLQLPETLDWRLYNLASDITKPYQNRFDKARAIEQYLRANYGYSLEMKASGTDPVSDFLFNVREGHCEYFASAMVLMLRSQGIASRLATGFQRGEYNTASGAFIVRQKNAHAWVEVYFPASRQWISFDPTPAASEQGGETAFSKIISDYFDMAEMLWIQYFVAFDNYQQRMIAVSFRKIVREGESWISQGRIALEEKLTAWWLSLRGDFGTRAQMKIGFYSLGGL